MLRAATWPSIGRCPLRHDPTPPFPKLILRELTLLRPLASDPAAEAARPRCSAAGQAASRQTPNHQVHRRTGSQAETNSATLSPGRPPLTQSQPAPLSSAEAITLRRVAF